MRKTIKLGGINITLSPSGISTSINVGGMRITNTAKGRVSTSIQLAPGLRYTKRLK